MSAAVGRPCNLKSSDMTHTHIQRCYIRYQPRQDSSGPQREGDLPSARLARVVVVEDSRSQWNVGAILRTAECLGWDVVLCGISPTPDQARSTVGKTALGSESWVNWTYAARVLDVVRFYQGLGYHLLALEQTDDAMWLDSQRPNINQPVCLFIGNERAGLSPELLTCVSDRVALPMQGRKASLNLAVSFGIAAFII